MGAGADAIGSVSVKIVGDASSLQSSFTAATQSATRAGETIGNAFNAAAIRQATLQLSVDTLRQKYDALAATGVRTAQAQSQMENVAARLDIANMRLAGSLNQVAASADKVSHSMVTGQQATSGFIRVAEGSGGLRAVENFLAKTLGLGPAMQAIFPIVGALAFGEIIVRTGTELVEFFRNALNFSRDFQVASGELNNELRETNAELAVSNDRLTDEIGKLTGHPTNGLQTILDENLLWLQKIEKQLDTDITKIDEFLKKKELGTLAGFVTGQESTAPQQKKYADSDARAKLDLDAVIVRQTQLITGAKMRAEQADKLNNATAKKAALDEAEMYRQEALTQIRAINLKQVEETADVAAKAASQESRRSAAPLTLGGSPAAGFGTQQDSGGLGQKAIQDQAAARIEKLQEAERITEQLFEQGGKQQAKTIAQQGKEAEAARKKNNEEWLKSQRDLFEDLKFLDNSTAAELEAFWNNANAKNRNGISRLEEAQKRGPDIVRSVQQEIMSARKKGYEELKAANEADLKEFENHIKQIRAAASAADKSPNEAEVSERQAAIRTPGQFGLRPEVAKKVAEPLPEKQAAAEKDFVASIKRGIEEINTAWELSGEHTAEQVRENAAEWFTFLEGMRITVPEIGALIDEWGKKLASATQKANAEALKLGAGLEAIQNKSTGQAQLSALDTKKLTLEQDYAAAITHTLDQQNDYADALAAIETKRLEIKLREAQIAHEEAEDIAGELGSAENLLKVFETQLTVQQARAALQLQQQQSEGAAAERARSQDISTQIFSGFGNTVTGAMNSLTKAITDLVTQSKGWGKEFDKALKQAEHGAVSSIVSAIVKKVEDEGKTVLKDTLGNTSGAPGTSGHLGGFGEKLGDLIFGKKPPKPPDPTIVANTTAHQQNTAQLQTLPPVISANTTADQQNTTELSILDATIRELIAALQAKTQGPLGGPSNGATGSQRAGGGPILVAPGNSGSGTSPGANGPVPGGATDLSIDFGEGKQDLGTNVTPGTPPKPLPPPPRGGSGATGGLGAIGQLLPGIAGLATAILGSTAGQKQHGLVVDLLRAATLANSAVTVANTIATILNTYVPKPLGFAGGGDPDTDRPFLAGEKGPELIHPKGQSLTVVPAGKTKQIMEALSRYSLSSPDTFTPEVPGSIASNHAPRGGSYANTITNNSNVGNFGNNHYHIYGAQNPREIMRQIADFEKRQTGKYSPANS